MLLNFQTFGNFYDPFLLLTSSTITLWSESILSIISPLLMSQNIVHFFHLKYFLMTSLTLATAQLRPTTLWGLPSPFPQFLVATNPNLVDYGTKCKAFLQLNTSRLITLDVNTKMDLALASWIPCAQASWMKVVFRPLLKHNGRPLQLHQNSGL